MIHSVYQPHPALAEFVDSITVVRIDFSVEKNISSAYTFVPSPTRFLCFYLQDKFLAKRNGEEFLEKERSLVIGPFTAPVELDLKVKHEAILVYLKPSGMFRLFGIPLHEIVDKDYDARLVLGAEVETVLERLTEAKSDDLKSTILQGYLLNKLKSLQPPLPFDKAMLRLVKNLGNLSMESIASDACLSLRQFERKSLERVGVSPKLYSKMIRFSHAYSIKEMHPEKSWGLIANQCGYFDQMHFIRDFKFFYGSTPGCLTETNVEHSVKFRALESASS